MGDKNFVNRSSMQISFITRLLGMTMTLFILILTVKAELLEYHSIAWQLSLVIPILFASLISNSKIVCNESLEKHRTFNLVFNSLSIALVANVVGLLIAKYISFYIGLVYFILFIGVFFYFLLQDWKSKDIANELIVLILLILLGLGPTFLAI